MRIIFVTRCAEKALYIFLASAKLTISILMYSNTFNFNWENQILDSETFNCCK